MFSLSFHLCGNVSASVAKAQQINGTGHGNIPNAADVTVQMPVLKI